MILLISIITQAFIDLIICICIRKCQGYRDDLQGADCIEEFKSQEHFKSVQLLHTAERNESCTRVRVPWRRWFKRLYGKIEDSIWARKLKIISIVILCHELLPQGECHTQRLEIRKHHVWR